MPCVDCEERRKAMKAYIAQKIEAARHWARLAKEAANAKAATNVRAKQAKRPDAQAEGSGQASEASAEHEQRSVEAHAGASAGARRVSVPRVRKAGGGKTGAR